jgi:hypothetical protein
VLEGQELKLVQLLRLFKAHERVEKKKSPIITTKLVVHHMVSLSKVLLQNEISNSREANMGYTFHLILFLIML